MNEKIGMYKEDEILEHLTEGEGRGFLGRSMYDAIFDKIHALKTENEQLQKENKKYKEVIDKLNFIKNRKNQGASQENINKMAIKFVNSYLKEVE